MFRTVATPHPNRRTSSDSVWPLRRADGTKLYEKPKDKVDKDNA